jgi:hypothetical protein
MRHNNCNEWETVHDLAINSWKRHYSEQFPNATIFIFVNDTEEYTMTGIMVLSNLISVLGVLRRR